MGFQLLSNYVTSEMGFKLLRNLCAFENVITDHIYITYYANPSHCFVFPGLVVPLFLLLSSCAHCRFVVKIQSFLWNVR